MRSIEVVAILPARPTDAALQQLDHVPGSGAVVLSHLEPYESQVARDIEQGRATPVSAACLLEMAVDPPPKLHLVSHALGDDSLVAIVEKHEQLQRGSRTDEGLRFISCFVRRDDITAEEFWQHWTTRHVPLVLAARPGFHEYVTGRVREATYEVDGVVEQRFASAAALEAHHGAVHGKADVVADAARFVGRFRSFVATPDRRIER